MLTDDQMRYPIGKFVTPEQYNTSDMERWLNDIRMLPSQLWQAVIGLNDDELNTPYRNGGWTLRQVVHHLPDSHLNAVSRVKFALTEDNPVIKPYDEAQWAVQADYLLPVEPSLKILEGLHRRMVAIFESLNAEQWERTFYHPEAKAAYTLKKTLATYSWHGRHHLAHITETRKRYGF